MATNDKYDRQLRLWGSHGQKALAEAHVILLGTSSAGSETLKNLVLPGIGRFTIVDDSLVENQDFGHDFFVTRDDIGKLKSQVVCDLMTEMNQDVQGNFKNQSVDEFLKTEENFIKNC